MELEGDRQKARRLATGVKSRGQPFAQARPGSSPDGNHLGASADEKWGVLNKSGFSG
jgi:hypothetical protein